jgi:hypothetical protein
MTDNFIDGNEFSLFRPDVIECFKGGGLIGDQRIDANEWYNNTIATTYAVIARMHGCSVTMSANRTQESRIHWTRDTDKIEIDGKTTPDHFKHAGYLCFWLRRRIVLEKITLLPGAPSEAHPEKFFLKYGSELCAFFAGFWLCISFEFSSELEQLENIVETLHQYEIPKAFTEDVCKLLRHKEVSPHALYLIYRALFTSLRPKEKERGHLTLV